MSAELESLLTILGYLLIILFINLNYFILSKTFGWYSTKVEVSGKVETSGKMKTEAGDNIYTELAAGKQVDAAKENRRAAELTLQAAETNERTEQLKLERVRLEHPGSA